VSPQSLGAGGALAKAVPDQYTVYHTVNLARNNEVGPDEGLYGNICVSRSALTRSRSTLRATKIQPEVRPRHLSGKVGTKEAQWYPLKELQVESKQPL
jgi:hypothetical protein